MIHKSKIQTALLPNYEQTAFIEQRLEIRVCLIWSGSDQPPLIDWHLTAMIVWDTLLDASLLNYYLRRSVWRHHHVRPVWRCPNIKPVWRCPNIRPVWRRPHIKAGLTSPPPMSPNPSDPLQSNPSPTPSPITNDLLASPVLSATYTGP